MSKADAQLLSLDLTAQAALLAAGEVSCTELIEQQLAAIAASQAQINSYIHVDAEGALAAATQSQQRRQRGLARPLEGLPIAVKDNIDVAGMVTTALWIGIVALVYGAFQVFAAFKVRKLAHS